MFLYLYFEFYCIDGHTHNEVVSSPFIVPLRVDYR